MCRVVSKGTEVTLDTVSNMLISTYIVKPLPCGDQIPREILPENELVGGNAVRVGCDGR
jgi:hypothetical protein